MYPKTYRSLRGDEILATLLDSTSEQDRGATRDLLHIVAHAMRVRLRLTTEGPGRRCNLPQPVRLVTWLLVGMAVVVWYGAIFTHNGPKNPGLNLRGIVDGFVFVVLALLIQVRRRLLYILVIGTLVAFLAAGLLATGPSGAGFIIEVPYALLIVLLIAGWHRFMKAIEDIAPPKPEGRLGTR